METLAARCLPQFAEGEMLATNRHPSSAPGAQSALIGARSGYEFPGYPSFFPDAVVAGKALQA